MASPSSRRKKALRAAPEHLAAVLRDGWSMVDPNTAHLAAVKALESRRLVQATHEVFVRCADTQDDDIGRMDRACNGVIYLGAEGHVEDRDFQCPRCDRRLFSAEFETNKHQEVRIQIRWKQIASFVRGQIRALDGRVIRLADGFFRARIAGKD